MIYRHLKAVFLTLVLSAIGELILAAELDAGSITAIALVITAMASLVAAIFAGVASIMSIRNAAHLQVVKEDVHKIELATNSMKDQLVKATGDAAHAEGKAEGKAEQKAEGKAESKFVGNSGDAHGQIEGKIEGEIRAKIVDK